MALTVGHLFIVFMISSFELTSRTSVTLSTRINGFQFTRPQPLDSHVWGSAIVYITSCN